MKINKNIFYYYFIAFLLLINLISGGVVPLGQDQSKDIVKMSLLIINILVIPMLGIKKCDFKVLTIYFCIAFFTLIASSLRTKELMYTIEKLDAILLGVPFSVLIILGLYNKIGLIELLKILVKVGFLLLLATFFYKLMFGFWDRNTRFFLNGANVFGWLMGLYFLASIYIYSIHRLKLFLFFSFFFLLGIFWSESKGTLLSSLLCVLMIVFTQFEGRKTKTLVFSIISLFIFFNQFMQEYIQSHYPGSRLLAIFRIFNGELQESDQGSIGVRSELFSEATNFFIDNPIFGIGLGNFKAYSISGFDYPHNAHIEIFAENGIFLGILYLVFLSYALSVSRGFLRIIIIYFLMVCTFSGDLGYLRFAFVFMLLSICIKNQLKYYGY
ncbi:MAG: O-antigen ligase family protein, partial [Clostridium sp.]